MRGTYKTSEEYFNKLNLLFNGIIAGTLLPFSIVFLGRQKDKFPPLLDGIPALINTVVLLVLAAGIAYLSFRNYKEAFLTYDKSDQLRKKMDFYYQASVKRYFLLGISSVCAIVGLLLNTHGVFVLFYLAVLFIFSLARPDARKLPDILGLSDAEKKMVLEKEEIPE